MPEFFSFETVEEEMGKPITGIVHIGAHYAEEAEEYDARGYKAIWFEGHPEYAKGMRANLDQYDQQVGFQALLSDTDGEVVKFWTTADEYSSSILKPAQHQIMHPQAYINGQVELTTRTFKEFWETNELYVEFDLLSYNLLIIDVQGSELKVYKGMGEWRNHFDAIISEYSTVEFYEGGPRIEDLDKAFTGYKRALPDDPFHHGDGLWVRQ